MKSAIDSNMNHRCHLNGRWWQCKECKKIELDKQRRWKNVLNHYRSKSYPEKLCRSFADLDQFNGEINEQFKTCFD